MERRSRSSEVLWVVGLCAALLFSWATPASPEATDTASTSVSGAGRRPWGQFYLFDVTAGAAVSDAGFFGAASLLGLRLTALDGWVGAEFNAVEVVYPRESQYSLYAPSSVYVHVAPWVRWEGQRLTRLLDVYAGGSLWATPLTRDDPEHFGKNEYYRVGVRLDVAGGEWARASHIGLDLGVMWSDDYANPGDLTRYEYAAVHLVYGSSF